jgi:hypothetical protein
VTIDLITRVVVFNRSSRAPQAVFSVLRYFGERPLPFCILPNSLPFSHTQESHRIIMANITAARPCLDVLMLASRLTLEHRAGLAELVEGMVRGEGCREEGEGVVAVESLRALAGALSDLLAGVGEEGGGEQTLGAPAMKTSEAEGSRKKKKVGT